LMSCLLGTLPGVSYNPLLGNSSAFSLLRLT
jgi:hypothetical protein